MSTPTHIITSGGLISAAFIENVREAGIAPARGWSRADDGRRLPGRGREDAR